MGIYRIYNNDFTYFYIITNDINKYIKEGCFYKEITPFELEEDIKILNLYDNY